MSAALAAGSFAFPFRPGWRRAWLVGVPLAFVCPIGLIPLLGYSVAATRSAIGGQPTLPAWHLDGRLLLDGALLLVLLGLVTIPFGLAAVLISSPIAAALPVSQPALARAYGLLIAGAPLALAWAFTALALVPTGVARYARTGRPGDLLDAPGSLRLLRRSFWAWNLAGVPIVTAWAVTVLAVPAGAVGAPFAAFYAILVSAHASSTLGQAAG